MRFMAGATGRIPGVLFRHHLRKTLGLGRVSLMAPRAKHSGIGLLRNEGRRVLRVAGQRSVTGFTPNVGVLAGLFHCHDIVVTGGAGFTAGENHRTGGSFVDEVSTIMTVLAET